MGLFYSGLFSSMKGSIIRTADSYNRLGYNIVILKDPLNT